MHYWCKMEYEEEDNISNVEATAPIEKRRISKRTAFWCFVEVHRSQWEKEIGRRLSCEELRERGDHPWGQLSAEERRAYKSAAKEANRKAKAAGYRFKNKKKRCNVCV